MSEKIIVQNETSFSMTKILPFVEKVIADGRVSNYGKNYCYVTVWESGIIVCASRNKKSDRFVVYHDPEKTKGVFDAKE